MISRSARTIRNQLSMLFYPLLTIYCAGPRSYHTVTPTSAISLCIYLSFFGFRQMLAKQSKMQFITNRMPNAFEEQTSLTYGS